MADHDYRCKENHITTVYFAPGASPELSQTCIKCGNVAMYDWSSKRVAGTVKNGTGGGSKMDTYLRHNKKI